MIMGHGSTQAFNKAVMEMHADALRQRGFDNVYIGYNETSYPLISDTLGEMVADGIREIVCLPFFIASGLHMTRDIPAKLGLETNLPTSMTKVKGEEVTIHFETPFGEDVALTNILIDKVKDLDEGIGRIGILLIGHGSKLPYNFDIVSLHAKRLKENGYPDAMIGFNEINDPAIEPSFNELLERGVDQIVALPLFIALGKHLTMDIPPRIGLGIGSYRGTVEHNGRNVLVTYAHPVGPDPRLTDLLVRKIERSIGEST